MESLQAAPIQYFALTGDKVQGDRVEQSQDLLDLLYKKYNPDSEESKDIQAPLISINKDELLTKAFNGKDGKKIQALYNGQWRVLGYPSQSEADQALCNHLAYWFNKDFYTIREVFRGSGLYRKKFDRLDYMTNTINKAINSCKESYQEYLGRKTYEAEGKEYLYKNDHGKTA